MTDKQKEAIERLNLHKELAQINNDCCIVNVKDVETALNLIQTQQAEIEKKDKMIDLMAEEFEDLKLAYFKKEDGGEFMGKYRTYNKNDWEQYFEMKAENGN